MDRAGTKPFKRFNMLCGAVADVLLEAIARIFFSHPDHIAIPFDLRNNARCRDRIAARVTVDDCPLIGVYIEPLYCVHEDSAAWSIHRLEGELERALRRLKDVDLVDYFFIDPAEAVSEGFTGDLIVKRCKFFLRELF